MNYAKVWRVMREDLQTRVKMTYPRRSTDAIALRSQPTSSTNWSVPLRSPIIQTCTAEKSWPWKSISQKCVFRYGFRIVERNGVDKKNWMPVPWSFMIPQCYPSTVPHLCTPVWAQWQTLFPWNHGSRLLCPVPHQCTAYQDLWAHRKASSPATPATAFLTLAHTTPTLTLTHQWAKGCRPWLPLLTNVLLHTQKNTLWRTWTSAALASLLWEWKQRSTFSPWTRHGNPCDWPTWKLKIIGSWKGKDSVSFSFSMNIKDIYTNPNSADLRRGTVTMQLITFVVRHLCFAESIKTYQMFNVQAIILTHFYCVQNLMW